MDEIEKFLEIIKNNYNNSPEILKAFEFAKNAHNDQVRDSGEPYIIHPVAAATILTDYGLDEPAIIACLLHDVVEDAQVTYKQIRDTFGKEVEEMVKGVTKIGSVKKYVSAEQQDIESLRRMFVIMAKDIRVVLIKLADRLHNMRTLNYLSPARQKKIATETKEIYVPLADRLGLCSMRAELEDLCLFYLNNAAYRDLEEQLKRKYTKRKTLVHEIEVQLRAILRSLGIKGEVTGRFKHFSSIYKKMQQHGTEKIYDIIAHRVIVDDVKDCYAVLGAIHNKWKPVPGRIKDYIASPKVNGYQSLHTTLLTPDGIPFEVQIRTHEMHKTCEYGIAAHWRYKDGGGTDNKEYEAKLDSIKQMVESNKQLKDSKNFVNAIKMDFNTGEIWAFTPKRKVVNLPAGSTPIDFAYSIHTNLGHNCTGAKVNGKIVSLATKLETGDVVEIITAPHEKAPSRDWLNIVRSPSAKKHIRAYFKREMKAENIEKGKTMLELEAQAKGYTFEQLATEQALKCVFKTYSFSSLDDMFASVGAGSLTTNQVIGRLVAEKINHEKKNRAMQINQKPNKTVSSSSTNKGVLVYGDDHVLVRLCKSCSPVPGDKIVGYSVGRGITIHREGCPCTKTIEKEREVEVEWIDKDNSDFNVNIEIQSEDRAQVLTDIINALSLKKVYINSISARARTTAYSLIDLSVRVKNSAETQEVINKLSDVLGVISVRRK